MKTNNDWDRRNVNFEYIHGNPSYAYKLLLKDMNIQHNQVIADMMCGYGEASSYLLEHIEELGHQITLFLIDSSSVQLNNSINYLASFQHAANISRHLSEAQNFSFTPESLDFAIIKMGLHELPLKEQSDIVHTCFNGLKTRGKLYIWEAFGRNDELNELFKKIVRKKDELAGFQQMVQNRYFATELELTKIMNASGFTNVRDIYEGNFPITNIYLSDLHNSESKIEEFNEFVRNIVPESLKQETHFKDYGTEIHMSFTKKILMGQK